ncbi:hypothetical protein AGABI2DRAFT_201707, partial [Agaricus bisporus var. bisporus H97]|uniref:hypothetical protein n=1 Tax=Agaricus bisporus var. bisporus (strain H97 / ATCC MYA-4626 / FGSC 10389) TaxID=936046 RepID=UPI00029F59C0
MSRLELAKIPALTFYKDAWTTSQRTSPIKQLTCVGKPCRLYQPEVVRCVNLGGSGTDVDWKCEADLPERLRFGKVDVSCEGWSKSGDPFVLKGSCGLEYRLVEVPGTLRSGRTGSPFSFLESYGLGDIIFTVAWVAFLVFILYNLVKSCLSRNNSSNVRRQRGSSSRPGGGGGGGGGGGWFPRRDDWSNPPPPYTKYPSNNGASEGWRPGFWSGAALGGLANHFWNNRRQAEPREYWNQWNQIPVQSTSSSFGYGMPQRR